MDNIQLILYIVFVVGYLIFKALTGGKKEPSQNADPNTDYDTPSPEQKKRPSSFEEILRELTGVGQPEEQQLPPEEEQYRKVKRKGKEISERTAETYKESVESAKKFTKLDDTIDLDNLGIGVKEVEELEEEEMTASKNYLDLLKNPDDAKKAIILSEIINRKY